MSTSTRIHVVGTTLVLLLAGVAVAVGPPATPAPPGPAVVPYRVHGPVTHENLSVYFLFGPDQMKGAKILTLDEALKDKKVIVHETKNVNQLAIENTSTDPVFVQAGDIVKGGQQDRTIAVDAIIPAKSGRLPIGSFCVEQGRWSKRGGENAGRFDNNDYTLVGNALKLACRGDKSQGGVWKEVNEAQGKLGRVVNAEVKDARSGTSLQLSLEHKKLKDVTAAYEKAFTDCLPCTRTGNVIGFAVAINGKVLSADVYANSDLFRRLWPKLMRSTVLEAVSEKDPTARFAPATVEGVHVFLAEASSGKRTERKVLQDLKEVQLDSEKNVYFETKADKDGAVLRRSYLKK